MTYTRFYDSAAPLNIPAGVLAAVYVNGYTWTKEEIDRMHAVIGVSVLPEPHWAQYARVLDIERFAAAPPDAPAFIRARRAHGHHDATLYVNRANYQATRDVLSAAGIDPDSVRWWVATLDGTIIPDVWATQLQGGGSAPYDTSVLQGARDFTPPHRF